MKQIPPLYKELLNELLHNIQIDCEDNLVSLVLYGSIARGDFRNDSDIDLLLIFEKLPKEKFLRQRIFIEIENQISFEKFYEKDYYPSFSPILKTTEEAKFLSPLYLDMVDDAVILFDKNSFFQNILETLRTRLSELGAIKKRVGDKWYWDLNPNYKFGDEISIE